MSDRFVAKSFELINAITNSTNSDDDTESPFLTYLPIYGPVIASIILCGLLVYKCCKSCCEDETIQYAMMMGAMGLAVSTMAHSNGYSPPTASNSSSTINAGLCGTVSPAAKPSGAATKPAGAMNNTDLVEIKATSITSNNTVDDIFDKLIKITWMIPASRVEINEFAVDAFNIALERHCIHREEIIGEEIIELAPLINEYATTYVLAQKYPEYFEAYCSIWNKLDKGFISQYHGEPPTPNEAIVMGIIHDSKLFLTYFELYRNSQQLA
jgi:hypothetical protein